MLENKLIIWAPFIFLNHIKNYFEIPQLKTDDSLLMI